MLTRTWQLSISSCNDNQRTWESKHGSFTHWVIEQLRTYPVNVANTLHSIQFVQVQIPTSQLAASLSR